MGRIREPHRDLYIGGLVWSDGVPVPVDLGDVLGSPRGGVRRMSESLREKILGQPCAMKEVYAEDTVNPHAIVAWPRRLAPILRAVPRAA